MNTGVLPKNILDRTKCAFSDSVSQKERCLYTMIQEHIDTIISDEEYMKEKDKFTFNTPFTKESYYYRKKFHEYFGQGKSNVIPHFWMPKWTNAKDPSARTLSVYSEN